MIGIDLRKTYPLVGLSHSDWTIFLRSDSRQRSTTVDVVFLSFGGTVCSSLLRTSI